MIKIGRRNWQNRQMKIRDSELPLHKEFKSASNIEKHLTCVCVRAYRTALTEEAEIKCLLCNLGGDESEIHFLLKVCF